MNRDRQLKKDMESREVQIHEEYEKNRHLMSEDKVKEKAAASGSAGDIHSGKGTGKKNSVKQESLRDPFFTTEYTEGMEVLFINKPLCPLYALWQVKRFVLYYPIKLSKGVKYLFPLTLPVFSG